MFRRTGGSVFHAQTVRVRLPGSGRPVSWSHVAEGNQPSSCPEPVVVDVLRCDFRLRPLSRGSQIRRLRCRFQLRPLSRGSQIRGLRCGTHAGLMSSPNLMVPRAWTREEP
jgi:hypothetical protein